MKNTNGQNAKPNRLLQQALNIFDQPEVCGHSQAFRSKRLGAMARNRFYTANVETLTPRADVIECEMGSREMVGEGA
jgi:hypothetical protein